MKIFLHSENFRKTTYLGTISKSLKLLRLPILVFLRKQISYSKNCIFKERLSFISCSKERVLYTEDLCESILINFFYLRFILVH